MYWPMEEYEKLFMGCLGNGRKFLLRFPERMEVVHHQGVILSEVLHPELLNSLCVLKIDFGFLGSEVLHRSDVVAVIGELDGDRFSAALIDALQKIPFLLLAALRGISGNRHYEDSYLPAELPLDVLGSGIGIFNQVMNYTRDDRKLRKIFLG
jgi:hypothetical protein